MTALMVSLRRLNPITIFRRWPDMLAVLAVGLLCLWFVGYFSIDISKPARLQGDHFFILGNAKSYIDGHGFRFNPDLGFPDQRDYAYFPSFDFTQREILWLGAHFTTNPFLLVYALYAISIVAIYGFSYWALRWLGQRYWVSVVAPLGLVLSPYLVTRAFGHDYLAIYYAAPLGAALALGIAIASPDTRLRTFFRQPFVLVAIFVCATSGLYYAFFTLMFISFLGIAASASQQRWFPLLASIICVAVSVPLLLIFGYGSAIFTVMSGNFPQPKRLPMEELMFGLNLGGSALPFEAIDFLTQRIANSIAAFPQFFSQEGAAEWPTLVLTLIMLGSPLIAAISTAPISDRGHNRPRLMFFASICIVFGLLYAARGGLGFLFSLFVSPGIRAPGRVIPFLMFFATVILATAIEFALTARSRVLRMGIPGVLIVASVLATVPVWKGLAKRQALFLGDPNQQLEWNYLHKLLDAKNGINAQRVFELPVIPWPEAPAQNGFNGYGQEALYILDKPHSSTKWSYGVTSEQPAFKLQTLIARDFPGLPERASKAGFDSLLVQKRAYRTEEFDALSAQFDRSINPSCKVYEDSLFAFYSLTKAPDGQTCLIDAAERQRIDQKNAERKGSADSVITPLRYQFGYTDSGTAKKGAALLLSGWSTPEIDFTWSIGEISYLGLPVPSLAPGDEGIEYTIDINLYHPDPNVTKTVAISVEGGPVVQNVFAPGQSDRRTVTLRLPRIKLAVGENRVAIIRVSKPDSPRDFGSNDGRVLGVQLFELREMPYSN